MTLPLHESIALSPRESLILVWDREFPAFCSGSLRVGGRTTPLWAMSDLETPLAFELDDGRVLRVEGSIHPGRYGVRRDLRVTLDGVLLRSRPPDRRWLAVGALGLALAGLGVARGPSNLGAALTLVGGLIAALAFAATLGPKPLG